MSERLRERWYTFRRSMYGERCRRCWAPVSKPGLMCRSCVDAIMISSSLEMVRDAVNQLKASVYG